MEKTNKSLNRKLSKWLDDCKLALIGIVLMTREVKFWLLFFPVFFFFGTLLNLLSTGLGPISLLFSTDLSGKLQILSENFLANFGIGKSFTDWILTFSISFLQAILISLIIIIWKNRTKDRSVVAQNAGIAAGLALLGTGCPTCGTTLITPLLGVFFSGSSYAIAGTLSGIITLIAIIILLFSLKKVGLEAYVIIKDKQWKEKHQQVNHD